MSDSNHRTTHIELLEEWNEEAKWNVLNSTTHKVGDGTVEVLVQDTFLMQQARIGVGDEAWYAVEHDILVVLYQGEELKRLVVFTANTPHVGGHRTQVLVDDPIVRQRDTHAHDPHDPTHDQDQP